MQGVAGQSIDAHLRVLMLCFTAAGGNVKELELIDRLETLLFQAQRQEPLNIDLLNNVRYKCSRVPCFAEKYFQVVSYLGSYQKHYCAHQNSLN